METGLYSIAAAIITAIVTVLGIIRATRKEKEDINIARTGQAIETWQELAESNKDHWDECEVRVNELREQAKEFQTQLNTQNIAMLKLQTEVYTLQLQVHGRMLLDAERNSGNDTDGS